MFEKDISKNSMTLEADSNILLTTFHLEGPLPASGLAPGPVLQLVAQLRFPPGRMDCLLHPSLRQLRAASQATGRRGSWLRAGQR